MSGGRNGTGKHQIPPYSARHSWYEKLLQDVKEVGNMPASDPVPSHLRKTKMLIDFVKWTGGLVVAIAAFGWLGHSYVSDFQTEEDAVAAQQSNDEAHAGLQSSIEHNGRSIGNLRVHNVRIELEQRNTSDRSRQLLELNQANTRRERQDAEDRVDEIERRIKRRERVLRNPAALQRLADRAAEDPLVDLDDL